MDRIDECGSAEIRGLPVENRRAVYLIVPRMRGHASHPEIVENQSSRRRCELEIHSLDVVRVEFKCGDHDRLRLGFRQAASAEKLEGVRLLLLG